MNTKKNIGFPMFSIGYITLIISVMLYIFSDFNFSVYTFAVGVVLTIIGRFLTLPSPDNFRIKRLNNMLALGALLLVGTAYLMFIDNNAWAITLTISAFIDIFTTYRYPDKKENK